MNCPGCNTPIPAGSNKCPMCGATVQQQAPTATKTSTQQPVAPAVPQKKCRHCAMMIPKEAKICPYCRKKLGWTLPAKIGMAFLILVIFKAITGENKPPSPVTEPAPKIEKKNDETVKALAAAMTIKKNMRNPDSFKLSEATLMKNGAACFEFRSQNGFGGMNAESAVLSSNGEDIALKGMPEFTGMWNKECAGKSGKDIVDYLDLALK